MNRTIVRLAVCAVCLTVLITGVQGADTGDPTGAALLEDSRIDFVVEKYERDVKYSDIAFSSVRSPETVEFIMPIDSGAQEETRFMARLSFPVHEKAFCHLDGGVSDVSDSEGSVAILGAGFRVFVYDSEGQGMDAAIFGSVHYVPRIDYKESSVDPGLGQVEVSQEESYMEANAGISLSYLFELRDDATLTPYGGVILSMLKGDEEVELTYIDANARLSGPGDLESDGMASVFGGVSYAFNEYVSVRAEIRLVAQTSFSAALSMSL